MATAVGAALPVLAADSFLPVADTAEDPGVLHAEGLSYLSDSGFPASWDRDPSTGVSAQSEGSQPARENFDEYFDSAPVAGLGEPAPVTTLPPLPAKKS